MRLLMRGIVAASLFLPLLAQAQLANARPGQRVRAVVPAIIPERVYATFVRATPDSVWLRDARGHTSGGFYRAPNLTLGLSQFAELDISGGVSRKKGALAGAGIGSIVPILVYATADKNSYGVLAAGALGLILVPAGTVTGAILGSERWERVLPAATR